MWPEHLELIRGYSTWFTERNTRPADMLRQLTVADNPLRGLLMILSHIPGYAGDPLQKKAMLLALTLENRPEHFLPISDPESAVPIIDYHLQRSALRTGLIRVEDPALRTKLEARELIGADEEVAIRQATYDAVEKLIAPLRPFLRLPWIGSSPEPDRLSRDDPSRLLKMPRPRPLRTRHRTLPTRLPHHRLLEHFLLIP